MAPPAKESSAIKKKYLTTHGEIQSYLLGTQFVFRAAMKTGTHPHIHSLQLALILEQAAQGSSGVTIPGGVQKNMQTLHFGTWLSRHGGVGLTVGLYNLRGLFQPE